MAVGDAPLEERFKGESGVLGRLEVELLKPFINPWILR